MTKLSGWLRHWWTLFLFLIMLCAILARINIYPWEFPCNKKRPLPFFRRMLKAGRQKQFFQKNAKDGRQKLNASPARAKRTLIENGLKSSWQFADVMQGENKRFDEGQ
jgi:hypothetical protein